MKLCYNIKDKKNTNVSKVCKLPLQVPFMEKPGATLHWFPGACATPKKDEF